MLVFLLLLALIYAHFLCEKELKNKDLTRRNSYLSVFFECKLLILAFMIAISALRAMSVGDDTNTYCGIYNNIAPFGETNFKYYFTQEYECGFVFICSLLKTFGLSFSCFLFVCAIFSLCAVFYFIRKSSKNSYLSLFLYIALGCFAQNMNLIRQILALSFVLFGVCLLQNKKPIWAAILFLVGVVFHKSCVFCLIAIALYYLPYRKNLFEYAMLACLICAKILPLVLKAIESIFPKMIYYSRYFVEKTVYIMNTSWADILFTLGLIFVVEIVLKARQYLCLNKESLKRYDFYSNMFMIVPLIRLVGIGLNMTKLISRLGVYFFIFIIILIPEFLSGIKTKEKRYKTILWTVIGLAFIYMLLLYMVQKSCHVYPYTTILG